MAADQILKKGTTSYLCEVALRDSVTGAGKPSLAAGSVACTYWREGAAAGVSVTLDGAAVLGTWRAGGWKETTVPGLYQFGAPDAALAAGANAVTFAFTASGAVDKFLRLLLTDADLRDAAGLGLSRLDAAVSTRATLTAAQVDTQLSGAHGAGAWGFGASGPSAPSAFTGRTITVGSTPLWTAAFTKDGAAWDLSSATVTLQLRDPSGAFTTHTGAVTNAAAGLAQYAATTTDLSAPGWWARRWVVMDGSVVEYYEWITFNVEA